MSISIVFLLSFVQGIAEFLPISSSLHISLLQQLFNLQYNNELAIGLHIGTLMATILYFYKDIFAMLKGFILFLLYKQKCPTIILNLITATIPAVVFGAIVVKLNLAEIFNFIPLIAFNLIFFGILLHIADFYSKKNKTIVNIKPSHSLFIGLAQAIALIPGVSRSGITISAGRFLAINKVDAVKFAFMISIPVTLGAVIMSLNNVKNNFYTNTDFLLTCVITFTVALVFIKLLIIFISKFSFKIFMIYRILLAMLLLSLFTFSLI